MDQGLVAPNAHIWLSFTVYILPIGIIGWGYWRANDTSRFPGLAATTAVFISVGHAYKTVGWFVVFWLTGKGVG
jgi:hypothetical protein